MTRGGLLAAVVAGGVLTAALQPAYAQSAALPPVDPNPLSPLDREVWAGMSVREAVVGLVVLGGGAAVVTWLTGSAISGITAAAAAGVAYVIYDPGPIGVVSKDDLPSLKDLGVTGQHDKD